MSDFKVFEEIEKYEFILCSSSPRRKDILNQIGFKPIIIKSNFKEDLNKLNYKNNLIKYVEDTSFNKLIEVYENLHLRNSKPKLLLSADTVILSNNKIFEKPLNLNDNIKMLKELRDNQNNGFKIEIITCCTIMKVSINGETITKKFKSISEIYLIDNLTDEIINEYCRTNEGLEVAGGFKIQGKGAILFKGIKGDFYNCVGLPINLVFEEISKLIL